MVKQILLRVASVVAEIFGRKRAEPRRCRFSFPGEILFSQDTLDPNVDRECAEALIGKKHNAVGDLRSDTLECTEVRLQFCIFQLRPLFESNILGSNYSRRVEKILCPIAEGALPQFLFRLSGERGGSGKSGQDPVFDLARLTELFAQCMRNLADMRDLFHRRAKKRRQTFPLRLSNDPQAATKIRRGVHYGIVREGAADIGWARNSAK